MSFHHYGSLSVSVANAAAFPLVAVVGGGRDGLAAARQTLKETQAGAVMLTLFVSDIGQKESLRHFVAEIFGSDIPATTTVAQKPCGENENADFVVELIAISGTQTTFTRPISGQSVVVKLSPDFRLHAVGNVMPSPAPIGAYARAFDAFGSLEKHLNVSGVTTTNLVRTWIYQGHLLSREYGDELQRYQQLNRARTGAFAGVRFLAPQCPADFRGTVFPASTGIGGDDWDVTLSGLAIESATGGSLCCVPLENPQQHPAFDYAAVYSPQSPKFVRAMTIWQNNFCWVLVSGTASITDSESRHVGDPAAQTHQTLDNIAALITAENLVRHGVTGFGASLRDLAVARVYIKNREDAQCISAICRERMPGVPTIFTNTDVCRDDLLVEIEGWAVAKETA